ncbi:hypothetical protein ACFL43_03440 [Thermodesulfobacteriota bacterium]
MHKTATIVMIAAVMVCVALMAGPVYAQGCSGCSISYTGTKSGTTATNETCRTRQATLEAFEEIWNESPFACATTAEPPTPQLPNLVGYCCHQADGYAVFACQNGYWYGIGPAGTFEGTWDVACSGSCDADADGINDACDNCPANCNSQQLDADADGEGDVCDATPGCGCGDPACEDEC